MNIAHTTHILSEQHVRAPRCCTVLRDIFMALLRCEITSTTVKYLPGMVRQHFFMHLTWCLLWYTCIDKTQRGYLVPYQWFIQCILCVICVPRYG